MNKVPSYSINEDYEAEAEEKLHGIKIRKVEQKLLPIYKKEKPFLQKISAFIQGETEAGRTVGSIIDFAQIFLPSGVATAREAAKKIVNRKQKQDKKVDKVKDWLKQPSSKAGLIVVTALLALVGVNIEPEFLGENLNQIVEGVSMVIAGIVGIYETVRKEKADDNLD